MSIAFHSMCIREFMFTEIARKVNALACHICFVTSERKDSWRVRYIFWKIKYYSKKKKCSSVISKITPLALSVFMIIYLRLNTILDILGPYHTIWFFCLGLYDPFVSSLYNGRLTYCSIIKNQGSHRHTDRLWMGLLIAQEACCLVSEVRSCVRKSFDNVGSKISTCYLLLFVSVQDCSKENYWCC